MKTALFRLLAGLIAIAAVWMAAMTIGDPSFREAYPFGIWTLIAGMITIIPTFTAYAIRGESGGNWFLVRITKLLALPEYMFARFVMRHIKVPPKLTETPPETKNPELPSGDDR